MDPEFKEETLYKYTLNLKVAVRETGLLLVIRSLGIRDLRTSLPLICESIDQNTVKNNLQDGFILLWHYQIEMSIP